jgi:hypothetical protein
MAKISFQLFILDLVKEINMKKKKIQFVYQPDPDKEVDKEKVKEVQLKIADFFAKKALEKMEKKF